LRQTGRMQAIPIILFGREYWQRLIDFQFMADQGTIDDEDLKLFNFVETAEEAWQIIQQWEVRESEAAQNHWQKAEA